MNKRIFKYPLRITDYQMVEMPGDAIIRSVQNQGGVVCLWAEVNTVMVPTDRHINIFGTGNPIPDDPGTYIGSVQDGPFVWHVYEAAS